MTATSPTVAILHLGTQSSLGGKRRVASLTAIFTAAGATVIDVPLLVQHRSKPSDVAHLGILDVVRGRSVPERMAWSRRSVRKELVELAPDVIVCITARAFDPQLATEPWTVLVDFVDRLSDSYRDRARILGRSPTSTAMKLLALTAARFERRALPPGTIGIAAGADDAEMLGLDWVPITVEVPKLETRTPPVHDILFLGKLSYAPNVEAIIRLARVWPDVLAARPETTLLLAGAAPTPEILATAQRCGWTVAADFEDLATVVSSARVATAPLLHASGIQIKVLDTAAFGLPQVIGPVVAKGFDPALPAVVVHTDAELVTALTHLLDDPSEQQRLGHAGRDHVACEYSVDRWVGWATAVLEQASAAPPSALPTRRVGPTTG